MGSPLSVGGAAEDCGACPTPTGGGLHLTCGQPGIATNGLPVVKRRPIPRCWVAVETLLTSASVIGLLRSSGVQMALVSVAPAPRPRCRATRPDRAAGVHRARSIVSAHAPQYCDPGSVGPGAGRPLSPGTPGALFSW